MKRLFTLTCCAFVLLMGCTDKDDSIFTVTSAEEVEDFIWKGLNYWYFWQSDVPDLADDRFSSSQAYTNFLTSFDGKDDLFYHLCNRHSVLYDENAIDRFSYVTDNYEELVNTLSGTFTTNGVEFGLAQFSNSDNVFGFVRYILPGSDAASKDIHRGDIFTQVDGTTLNLSNYSTLLFGENSTYTLTMAEITDPAAVTDFNPEEEAITNTGQTVTLTKSSYTENPIFIVNTHSAGSHEIGYLMYNSFTNEFDSQLNDAFAQLQAANVTDLVLDLRYNGGGSVNTARILASLITGQFNGQLFNKQRWNDKVQPQLSSDQLNDNFTNRNSDGANLNSLNLNKVYVLTSSQTASASELVINGLTPYIDVVQIGNHTRGKNEFSITLVDDPGNSYVYSPNRVNQINPNNSWAMQPLVGKNENADGFYEFTDTGLLPDTELLEDLTNLGTLGDANEPLLAEAISQITGAGRRQLHVNIPIKEFTSTKGRIFSFNNAYIENPFGDQNIPPLVNDKPF